MKYSIPFPRSVTNCINKCFFVVLLSCCGNFLVAQDCDLACNGTPEFPVQVVINDQCMIALVPSILVPDPASCPGDKRLTVRDSLNNLVADGIEFVQFAAGALVGNRLSVTITDQTTGTLCVSTIRVVDNNPPTITQCNEVTVNCQDSTAPDVLGFPMVDDNCDTDLELTFVENILLRDCLSDTAFVILRDWTVADDNGLTATCTQEINVLRASSMEVTFPADVTLPCDDPSADPDRTGRPLLNDMPLLHGGPCGLTVSSTEDTAFICNDYMYRIDRTWTVTETCTDFFAEATQVILISDDEGPNISCPPANQLAFSSDPGECSATIALPIVTGTDNCGSEIAFSVTSSYGATDFSPVSGVTPGSYAVTYQGTDECGNTSTCSTQLTVTDDVAPVAACDDQVLVAVGSSGYGVLQAAVFNEGSSDNCGPVFLKAKRVIGASCDQTNGDDSELPGYQEWLDDSVIFCCEDIENGTVSVLLRVYETDPGGGPVDPSRESGNGDLVGRYTDCQSTVTVQDGAPPTILQCPAPLTIDCTDEQDVLSVYGSPVVQDNCGFTLDSTFTTSFNQCGVGTILRTWTATDNYDQSSSCSQLITVENNEALTEDDITWPVNVEFYECGASTDNDNLPEDALAPIIDFVGCGSVAVNSTDALFNTVPGACFKILRTWVVIDWCNYDPSTPGAGGRFTHTQQIKVFDQTDPVITCPEPVTVNVSSDCTTATVTLDAPTVEDCSAQITITNNSLFADSDGADASGTYPVGVTTVRFTANDNCSNHAACTTTVTVADTQAPSLACILDLTTNLMPTPDGGVRAGIDASALVASATDNCDLDALIKFSINRPGDGTIGVPLATTVTFDCYDAGTAAEVMVWATDSNDNSSSCLTSVTVQDPNNNCVGQTGSGVISGGVITEMGQEVENVMIMVAGSDPTMAYTEIDGSFMFEDLETGNDYSVLAEYNEGILNGVTTYDLILIGKHILGTTLLDSPYKLIAADADRSGHVSTLDIIKLRKLILHITTELPNGNSSWRFVDAEHIFADPTNPFAGYFPEILNINDLDEPEMHTDFIAIKVGDVNASAVTSSIQHSDEGRSSAAPLEFKVAEATVQPGETIDIPFTAQYMNEWMGYQFTLEYDPGTLDILEVIPGDLPNLYPEENFHFYDNGAGLLTTVWNEYGGSAGSKEMVVFTLRCNTKQAGNVKEWLYLSSRVTQAEAYTQEGEPATINLVFSSNNPTEIATNFELFQNRPNPWNNSTIIPFQLDPGGDARLSVYDMAGKKVYEVAKYFPEGYHEINILRNDLPAVGLFYYTLEAGEQRATRKMVLTD